MKYLPVAVVLVCLAGCNPNPTWPPIVPDAEEVYREVPAAEAMPHFGPPDEDRLTYGGEYQVDGPVDDPAEVPWNKKEVPQAMPADGGNADEDSPQDEG